MSEIEFIAGLATQPDPPCETHCCEFFDRCAESRLACSAFATYVRDGIVVKPSGLPSRRKYNELMQDAGSNYDRHLKAAPENAAAP